MKLGYSTWGMPTVPIDTAISHLASLGYDGVELTIIPRFTTELSTLDAAERKRISSLFQQHNLALPAIAAHSSLLETDPEIHAKNMWRLKGGVDLAVDLAQGDELPAVNTTPGGKPEEWESKKDFLAERVGALADYGASRGCHHRYGTPYRRNCRHTRQGTRTPRNRQLTVPQSQLRHQSF